jgi:DNA-binding transcriptional ArsR family regulator/uncharacterized protein YndB with AHSA1/START domain
VDDEVFKALGDPTRRRLLDALFEREGQSLGELGSGLSMTRPGVAKHIAILEAAGLVVSRREGRRKLHHLNPVPIRLIHDRWIGKFSEALVGHLAGLKRSLEAQTMSELKLVFEVFIQATPERVWSALTDNELIPAWAHSLVVTGDWEVGGKLLWKLPDGRVATESEIIELTPPNRLVCSTRQVYMPEMAAEPPYKLSWEIDAVGKSASRVRVTSWDFATEGANYKLVKGGQRAMLDTLKTLLETGQPLVLT